MLLFYVFIHGLCVSSFLAEDTQSGSEVCGVDDAACAVRSAALLQTNTLRKKIDIESKGGKGRSSSPRPRPSPRRDSPRPRPAPSPAVSTGGPGAPWTEEEAMAVMAKVVRTIRNTKKIVETGIFDDFECMGGPNFSQACDGNTNEFCVTDTCVLEPGPDVGNLDAKYLRLGFHDCIKYTDGSGGCDGCLEFGPMFGKYTQLHGAKNNRDKNRKRLYGDGEDLVTGNNGLAAPADILEKIYTDPSFPDGAETLEVSLKDSGKSRADLWAFAALVAAEHSMKENNLKCKGTSETKTNCEHTLQHSDTNYCEIEQHYIPRFYTGRSDCAEDTKPSDPATSSRVPHKYRDYETTKSENGPSPYLNGTMLANYFNTEFGLSARETVAIMGAHSLGGFNFMNSMFKYRWQFGNDFMLNNVYYRNIMAKPARKQICAGKKEPATWAGGPGGGLANVGWWVRPLREVPSGGPFLWFHYYHRCPTCYKDSSDHWISTEERGETSFQKDECCACHEQDESEVSEECFIKVVHDETAISADMGLFYSFEVGPQGQPLGCPGLKASEWSVERLADKSLDSLKYDVGGLNTWDTEPGCPRNDVKDAGDDMSMSDYVELYAENQDVWVADFYPVLEKVLYNGYDVADLELGPDVFGIERIECENTGKGKSKAFRCVHV